MPNAQVAKVTTSEPREVNRKTVTLAERLGLGSQRHLCLSAASCACRASLFRSLSLSLSFHPSCLSVLLSLTYRSLRLSVETVPRQPRTRLRAGVAAPNSRTEPTFSPSCYPLARRVWIQHLAKVLRLPRNLYLTLRKCCACHEIYT